MTVTERVFYELKKQGKTANSMCQHLGIANNVVANWKKMTSIPPAKYLVEIANHLNVSVGYLLTGFESNALTSTEVELLKTYEQLDVRGKHQVHTTIYKELDRMDETKSYNSKVAESDGPKYSL